MQDFKNYYNPSTALMWPKECGFGYDDYLQFVDDTIDANQSNITAKYVIRYRVLESDYVVNATPGYFVINTYCAPGLYPNYSTYQWYTLEYDVNLSNVSYNLVKVPVADLLASNPNGNANTLGLALSGKNIQWCWGRMSGSAVDATGSVGGMIMNISADAINNLQNYQFVKYTDGDGTISYGYLCKYNTTATIANTVVIYKYVDGAINMTTPTAETCVSMTSVSGTIDAYMVSDWVNCYFYPQLSNNRFGLSDSTPTFAFSPTSIKSVNNTFTCSMSTQPFGGNFPFDFRKFVLYNSGGTKVLFQSEYIYDQNLSYTLDGINPNQMYMAEMIFWIKDGYNTTGKTALTTNIIFDRSVAFPIVPTYNLCEDHISINFVSWREYVSDCHSLKLYIRDINSDVLYDTVWDYVLHNDDTNNQVIIYKVGNGRTYQLMLYGTDLEDKLFYQNLGTFTIKFDGYFLDDTKNNKSYHMVSSLNGGNLTVTNNISEIKQNLQYNANMIGMTKFANGAFGGQLVSDNGIDNNYIVQKFKSFVSSNTLTYYKTPNGECYSVFVTDIECASLSQHVKNSPINVNFNWHQVADTN